MSGSRRRSSCWRPGRRAAICRSIRRACGKWRRIFWCGSAASARISTRPPKRSTRPTFAARLGLPQGSQTSGRLHEQHRRTDRLANGGRGDGHRPCRTGRSRSETRSNGSRALVDYVEQADELALVVRIHPREGSQQARIGRVAASDAVASGVRRNVRAIAASSGLPTRSRATTRRGGRPGADELEHHRPRDGAARRPGAGRVQRGRSGHCAGRFLRMGGDPGRYFAQAPRVARSSHDDGANREGVSLVQPATLWGRRWTSPTSCPAAISPAFRRIEHPARRARSRKSSSAERTCAI